MKTIGITANCDKPNAAAVLDRLAAKARALGLQLVVCDATARRLRSAEKVSRRDFPERIEALMVLGGDGTMLQAVRLVEGRDVAVLGVNLGSLGFMTTVTDPELEHALECLAAGRFTTSRRTMAEAVLWRGGRKRGSYRALNDVVIGWGETSRVAALSLRLNGQDIATYVCDGVILSTPTGSTGHSLSAGGPILLPESPVFVLNPICPHSLSNRPMVVPDDSTVEMQVARSSKELLFVVDGQDHCRMAEGDKVVIRKSAIGVQFIHLPGYNYFSLLSQKLHWRGSSL